MELEWNRDETRPLFTPRLRPCRQALPVSHSTSQAVPLSYPPCRPQQHNAGQSQHHLRQSLVAARGREEAIPAHTMASKPVELTNYRRC